jgi:hypothetical protein
MYFPKLPRFLENCSPSLTTFIVFGTSKVNLDFLFASYNIKSSMYVENTLVLDRDRMR